MSTGGGGGASRQLHLLRVVLSCRKITAQVTNPTSDSIVAMATTTEPEFSNVIKAKRNHLTRHRSFIDPRIASRIGEKLGGRLKEIGVDNVKIDFEEELSRPIYQQKMVGTLFQRVKQAGINISGDEKLVFRD